MSIKIAVLGSTGSIGTTTVDIIKKNLNDFKVIFLSTNNNVMKINLFGAIDVAYNLQRLERCLENIER